MWPVRPLLVLRTTIYIPCQPCQAYGAFLINESIPQYSFHTPFKPISVNKQRQYSNREGKDTFWHKITVTKPNLSKHFFLYQQCDGWNSPWKSLAAKWNKLKPIKHHESLATLIPLITDSTLCRFINAPSRGSVYWLSKGRNPVIYTSSNICPTSHYNFSLLSLPHFQYSLFHAVSHQNLHYKMITQ